MKYIIKFIIFFVVLTLIGFSCVIWSSKVVSANEIVYLSNEYGVEFSSYNRVWVTYECEEGECGYWNYQPNTDTAGHVSHDGTVSINLNAFSYHGIVAPEVDCDASYDNSELFYLPDGQNETREAVIYNEDGYFEWSGEGVYEMDVYRNCIYLMYDDHKEDSIFAWLRPNIAHAEEEVIEGYIGTIRFTVAEEGACIVDCFSNVLFLPGFKGSILQNGSDTIWPPTILSNDIPQLALTSGGESVNDVKVAGILKYTSLGGLFSTDVYGGFSDYMDSISGDGNLITEWLPLAYDWRFLPENIIAEGIKTDAGVVDVIESIENLASNSKTGKVTIVGHSMGGLMGKAIIKKLEEDGKADLVDAFVMVGTPQLGTPQAVASLLHGDGESILGGLIVNSSEIRAIGQNMPSAYNLLPSPRYFDEVIDPVLKFDPNASFTENWRIAWGDFINTYTQFLSFMTNTDELREKPAKTNLKTPEILRPDLMGDVASFHEEFDEYEFPEHIRVVQVAGWGLPTTKAVNYTTKHFLPGYEASPPTREGDGTVVYASAISSTTDETYFFNIFDHNKFLDSNAQHRDLLNTNTLKNIVETIVKKETMSNIDFISTAKPTPANLDDVLIVSSYSPVILGAYDQSGNFTGIDPNQDLSADILLISEEIPGSTFSYTSESQHIFLPKEGSYDFVYIGVGSGPTTVTIENFSADTVIPVASYTDMPTTTDTLATFAVESSAPENTNIALDTNGDGTTDETILPDGVEEEEEPEELSLNQLILLIKEKISTLVAKDNLKKNLTKKIESLEKKIAKKKEKDAKVLAKLEQKIINKADKGKIDAMSADEIIAMIGELEATAESEFLDSTLLADIKLKIQSLNIKQNLKNDLIKRIEKLENKQAIVTKLSNITKNIEKKGNNGKLSDSEVQELIDLLTQIEGVI